MKLVITLLVFLGLSVNLNLAYAASGAGMDSTGSSLYKSGKKLIIKAKKLEKKEKIEKAQTLYLKALSKLEKAYDKDKKNADILNYLGFALRKTGDLEKAEKLGLDYIFLSPVFPTKSYLKKDILAVCALKYLMFQEN